MQRTVCSDNAARCLSKSYIALPITVVAVEIARDVLVDRRFKRHKAGVITRTSQALDARLGEVLILAADRLGHIDIFNICRQMKRLEHCADYVAKAFCLASADVEDAVYPRCLKKPAKHRNRVVDVNEVAPLISVGDARTMRFEQTDRL